MLMGPAEIGLKSIGSCSATGPKAILDPAGQTQIFFIIKHNLMPSFPLTLPGQVLR
jgi:hypothetical protein